MSKTKYMMGLTPEERSRRMKEIRAQRKSPGYFASLSKEELSAISKKGGLNKKHGSIKADQSGQSS